MRCLEQWEQIRDCFPLDDDETVTPSAIWGASQDWGKKHYFRSLVQLQEDYSEDLDELLAHIRSTGGQQWVEDWILGIRVVEREVLEAEP